MRPTKRCTRQREQAGAAYSVRQSRRWSTHERSAARRGATAEEVAEALGVTILMNGGPGTVHAPRAFEAFREFTR